MDASFKGVKACRVYVAQPTDIVNLWISRDEAVVLCGTLANLFNDCSIEDLPVDQKGHLNALEGLLQAVLYGQK